jgi:hypothetical protein
LENNSLGWNDSDQAVVCFSGAIDLEISGFWSNSGGDERSCATVYPVLADPLFVDYSDDGDSSHDDLRLAIGSPLIDAALASSTSLDIDDDTKPLDGDGIAVPDIGADEV